MNDLVWRERDEGVRDHQRELNKGEREKTSVMEIG